MSTYLTTSIWTKAAWLSLTILCGGCDQTSRSQTGLPEREVAGNASMVGGHLIVSWPERAGRNVTLPRVTLKIPERDLAQRPYGLDEKGNVRWVYLRLPRTPHGNGSSADGALQPGGHHFVVIDRETTAGGTAQMMMRREALAATDYRRDGSEGILERYSRLECDQNAAERHEGSANSASSIDALVPGCRLNRMQAILVPPDADRLRDFRVAGIRCYPERCTAYFRAAQRGAHVFITHDDIPRWDEILDSLTKAIDSFVVPYS